MDLDKPGPDLEEPEPDLEKPEPDPRIFIVSNESSDPIGNFVIFSSTALMKRKN